MDVLSTISSTLILYKSLTNILISPFYLCFSFILYIYYIIYF
nr:MAG TPA: hypothetical protein [Caudoviricetes sp.]